MAGGSTLRPGQDARRTHRPIRSLRLETAAKANPRPAPGVYSHAVAGGAYTDVTHARCDVLIRQCGDTDAAGIASSGRYVTAEDNPGVDWKQSDENAIGSRDYWVTAPSAEVPLESSDH